jgi:lantibiotic transport system permease protein
MTALGRALWAEALKTKRTLALWLAILIPLAVVLLQFMIFFDRGQNAIRKGAVPWLDFIEQTLFFWALLALPLFITLETALLSNLEHRSNQWKRQFALPLPRWTIYAAKQLSGMAMIALSLLALSGFTVLAGLALQVVRPEIGLGLAIPWGKLMGNTGLIYLGSWLIISIHTWVGARWASFALASGVGIVMTIAGIVVINVDWGTYYPWIIPAALLDNLVTGGLAVGRLLLGCLGGVVAAIIGGWEFTRRDVL